MTSAVKAMTKVIILLGCVETVVLFAWLGGKAAAGVALGSFGAVMNLLILWHDVRKCVAKRKPMIVSGFIVRYTISGILLFLAGLLSVSSIFGAFLGLINGKIAAFLSWRWIGEDQVVKKS